MIQKDADQLAASAGVWRRGLAESEQQITKLREELAARDRYLAARKRVSGRTRVPEALYDDYRARLRLITLRMGAYWGTARRLLRETETKLTVMTAQRDQALAQVAVLEQNTNNDTVLIQELTAELRSSWLDYDALAEFGVRVLTPIVDAAREFTNSQSRMLRAVEAEDDAQVDAEIQNAARFTLAMRDGFVAMKEAAAAQPDGADQAPGVTCSCAAAGGFDSQCPAHGPDPARRRIDRW